MGDVATPALLVRGNASPHEFSLRLSDARLISRADIVFSVSDELTPWLGSAVERLAQDAHFITLLDQEGVTRLPARTDAIFADDLAKHDGSVVDPHAWLDPNNAMVWVDSIVMALSSLDNANAATYAKNAAAAKLALLTTRDELAQKLLPLTDQPFMVFHDSFQYFETLFQLNAIGAISSTDAVKPGPARVEYVRRLVRDESIHCMLTEPTSNSKLIDSVRSSQEMAVVSIDVLGTQFKPGADLYKAMMMELASSLEKCLQ